jgi:hypothetical protein
MPKVDANLIRPTRNRSGFDKRGAVSASLEHRKLGMSRQATRLDKAGSSRSSPRADLGLALKLVFCWMPVDATAIAFSHARFGELRLDFAGCLLLSAKNCYA